MEREFINMFLNFTGKADCKNVVENVPTDTIYEDLNAVMSLH